MAGAASYDWIFLAVGWTVAALAAALLAWALFWDRSRGRRRCPRCWYDMQGVPGLTCPECGREAKRERRLKKTRRRWRWATVAVLLGAIGFASVQAPRYRQGGWVALVPSSVLIYIAKPETAAWQASYRLGMPMPPPSALLPLSTRARIVAGTPGDEPVAERLHAELWRRLNAGSLWNWQAQIYGRRLLEAYPKDAPSLRTLLPPRWPRDRMLRVTLDQWRSMPFPIRARLASGDWQGSWVEMAPNGQEVFYLRDRDTGVSNGRTVHAELGIAIGTYVIPAGLSASTTDILGTVEDFLDRVDTPEVTDEVAAALSPRLVKVGSELSVEFHGRVDSPAWRRLDFGVHFTAEVRVGDRVVARGKSFADSWRPFFDQPFQQTADHAHLRWLDGATLADVGAGGGAVTLVIKGDPVAAGLAYCSRPFDLPRPACWAGRFETEVKEIEELPPPPRDEPPKPTLNLPRK